MTDLQLMGLATTSRVLFTDDFLAGRTKPDFADHVVPLELGRSVDLGPLDALLDHAMRQPNFKDKPGESDGWLSPRVHAALRLKRSEAADKRLWAWLAVTRYSNYVRWRFPGEDKTAVKRFIGSDRDHALSRLWWGGELTRNGGDYAATQLAFANQDIPNTWFSIDAFHNRAAALAAVRMLTNMGSKPTNRLSTAFNHFLTTIMLDTIAPLSSPDLVAMEEWVASTPNLDLLLLDELPAGPEEDPVNPDLIDAVERLVRDVAEEVGIDLSDDL
jgi:Family of unknown function (DUF6339)